MIFAATAFVIAIVLLTAMGAAFFATRVSDWRDGE